jgi:hypothetical protein
MKKNISSNLFILLTVFVLFACKSKKPLIDQQNVAKEIPKPENKIGLKSILANQLDFTTFNTKAATQLFFNDKNFDVTLNIRIKKNEIIWISITAIAGVEVARVLITPDSIQVMDRINDEYLRKPFQFIQGFTSKQVDYATLEALLVGNAIPFTLNEKSEITQSNEVIMLKGMIQRLSYQLQFNKDFKANQTFLEDIAAGQMLNINTESFGTVSEKLVPLKVLIASKTKDKQVKVDMQYSKTMLNTVLDFPFNVPKRFSVIN